MKLSNSDSSRSGAELDNEELLERAIGKLKEVEQIIVRLRFLGNVPYREIAHGLGIPVRTLRSHTCRGIKKLRKILRERDDG